MLNDFVKKDLSALEESLGREEEMKRALLEEAGIEDYNANKLRNSMLSAQEAALAKKEQLDDIRARKSRKLDWQEFADAPRRWGRALHHSDIIPRLRRLIPHLYVCDGMMKYKDGSIDLGLYVWDKNKKFEDRTGGAVYLGYIHEGWNPEYEIDIVNDVGIATKKMRGWRTMLMKMICRREEGTFLPSSLFTEEAAEREFGLPTNGQTASYYRLALWEFRNTTPEQAKLEYELMQLAQKYNYR